VIGGAQVYREFMPHIERWLVTEVPLTVSGADAFMPDGYLKDFKRVETRKLDDELRVLTYERK